MPPKFWIMSRRSFPGAILLRHAAEHTFPTLTSAVASLLRLALLSIAFAGAHLSAQPTDPRQTTPRPTALPAPQTLPAFSVKDQFERPLVREALTGLPVLFIVSAREGADAARRWFASLREPARARGLRIVSVADLKGAPRLLKGVIRRSFPKDTAESILMDFDGRLGRVLRGDKAALVAVVYGADGRLQRAVELPLSGPDVAISAVLLGSTPKP